MEQSRFFRITDAQAYEATRLSLDAGRGVPAGETTYEPLHTAPRASNGDLLLAIRAAHCVAPDIAAALNEMVANEWGSEISSADYWAALAQQNTPIAP